MPSAKSVVRNRPDTGRERRKDGFIVLAEFRQSVFGDQGRTNGVDLKRAGHGFRIKRAQAFFWPDFRIVEKAGGNEDKIERSIG